MFDKIRDEYDKGPVATCPTCTKSLSDIDREKIRFIFTADLKVNYERQVVESNALMLANVRLEADNVTLRSRVAHLEDENSTLRFRVAELGEENKVLRASVQKLTKENEELRARVKQLEKENATLNARVKQLEKENEALHSRVQYLEKKVLFLEEGHAETNKMIAQMKATIDQLIQRSQSRNRASSDRLASTLSIDSRRLTATINNEKRGERERAILRASSSWGISAVRRLSKS